MPRFNHLGRVGRRSLAAVLLLACLAVAAGPVLAEGTEKTGYPPTQSGEDEGAPSVTYTQGAVAVAIRSLCPSRCVRLNHTTRTIPDTVGATLTR